MNTVWNKNIIAFFAHYDPDGVVADYVVHYVSGLYEAGVSQVYFGSDADLKKTELTKLPVQTKIVNASRHGEYDFGSWKRCLDAFLNEQGIEGLSDVDSLVLCNDSCYGPLFSLQPMFEKMNLSQSDYWGITQVQYFNHYFPTFFIVLKNRVLRNPELLQFFREIDPFADKFEYCMKYEVGLNRWLESKGHKGSCFLSEYEHLCHSSSLAMDKDVFKAGMPFIRVMTARENPGGISRLGEKIRDVCSRYSYPVSLIESHLLRVSPSYEKFWNYLYPNVDKKILGFIHLRKKIDPSRELIRLKVKVFGIPIFYWVFRMRYVE